MTQTQTQTQGLAVCAKCMHSARGKAIDMRPDVKPGEPPRARRPSLRGGDWVCAREGLTATDVHPVTGVRSLPRGPDCRDLNPDGRCPHYRRGMSEQDAGKVVVAVFVGTLGLLVVLALAGAL